MRRRPALALQFGDDGLDQMELNMFGVGRQIFAAGVAIVDHDRRELESRKLAVNYQYHHSDNRALIMAEYSAVDNIASAIFCFAWLATDCNSLLSS